jgi:cell division protein ZapA
MAQLTIDVNGRAYVVGCEDGQEQRLLDLAKLFDKHVRDVARDVGQLGETRLFLMGALLLADELADLKLRHGAMSAELNRVQGDQGRIEARAAQALDDAARRIEKLAADH